MGKKAKLASQSKLSSWLGLRQYLEKIYDERVQKGDIGITIKA